ncbi:Zn-ribbon domain-containing OB-fold protein [Sporichthya polymorpha]|uniref:Zn-ribbon domain-containing OB-fold protein n=1 Tax=Sporichthya polymorpha TaxID=35751 RepID=UPI00035F0C59|nr:OB-fold domain-containing protein [Sporichthya polymorpha]
MNAVADDLLTFDDAGVALAGSHCTGCGANYFPRAVSCRNPECDDKTLVDTALGRSGTLFSWTVQYYRPPALFRADAWEPSAVGLVELPEGLRVMAPLTDAPPGEIPIGSAVQLTTLPLYTDDGGRLVVTYAYEPVPR